MFRAFCLLLMQFGILHVQTSFLKIVMIYLKRDIISIIGHGQEFSAEQVVLYDFGHGLNDPKPWVPRLSTKMNYSNFYFSNFDK